MNKALSIFQRILCPDPVLFWAYLLPLLYWSYLTLTTNFVLVFDAEGFYDLGNLFYHGQWADYFRSGPGREPLYPLLITISMGIGKWLGVSYTYPLKIICFGILAATMRIIQQALKITGANRWIQAAAVMYTGLSPILINSALCLYSEIATFPWLVGAALSGIYFIRSLQEERSKDLSSAIWLGFCLLGFTFVKGIGEILAPVFLFLLLGHVLRHSGLKISAFMRRSKLKILLVLLVFYIPLLAFKSVNFAFNGHFALTDRGDMSLYGPLTQRAQTPLTPEKILSHLSTVPVSYSLCSRFFTDEKCSYWYASADLTFGLLQEQFKAQNLSIAQQNRIIHNRILAAVFFHPLRQSVHTLTEGLKMFFWETSQGSFVIYPSWLEGLFNAPGLVLIMSLGAGFFCIGLFFIAGFLLKNESILVAFILVCSLILLFSFANIIQRYTIIAGPLMILLNASCLSALITKSKN